MGVVFSDEAETETNASLRWYERTAPSTAVLTVVLLVGLALTDTMGFLSTDVGGKLATLEAMSRNGTWSPDLGYWAVDADPETLKAAYRRLALRWHPDKCKEADAKERFQEVTRRAPSRDCVVFRWRWVRGRRYRWR